MRRLIAFLLLATLASACQKASRFGPVAKAPTKEDDSKAPTTIRPDDLWLAPKLLLDTPIVFVPSTDKDWKTLPAFWNESIPQIAGIRTIHVGQEPLQAIAGLVAAWQADVVRIKVPLGLPDPTPNVPKANPPTVGKWHLGKQLFFDKILQTPSEKLACISCHMPPRFTNDFAVAPQSLMNTPSLINVAYNRRQFWDGRVKTIEETFFRQPLQPPSPKSETLPHHQHNWTGVVELLRDNDDLKRKYQPQFERVFGIRQPTHDAIAKALATYVRTLLSGASIYDHAVAERVRRGQNALSAEHFEAVLDQNILQSLDSQKASRSEMAKDLAHGHELFHGRAGCVQCHPSPLFTDHEFYNVGLGKISDLFAGQESGRFANMPTGLKEKRLIGAHRTPSLRALPRTAPYMHDGTLETLDAVVSYFNKISPASVSTFLAPQLQESPGRPRNLELTQEEARALVRFLRSLDGQTLDKKLIEN